MTRKPRLWPILAFIGSLILAGLLYGQSGQQTPEPDPARQVRVSSYWPVDWGQLLAFMGVMSGVLTVAHLIITKFFVEPKISAAIDANWDRTQKWMHENLPSKALVDRHILDDVHHQKNMDRILTEIQVSQSKLAQQSTIEILVKHADDTHRRLEQRMDEAQARNERDFAEIFRRINSEKEQA